MPEYTIINCPRFQADPARHGCRSETVIALNFDKKLILIANTEYAGENKKAVFTLLNYLLPAKGVMAMHCSANHAFDAPDDAAVFFGLSGTGKTTLSADPARILIGDDEHGWSIRACLISKGGVMPRRLTCAPSPNPHFPPVLARLLCPAGPKFMADCCNKKSTRMDQAVGWSIPAGQAAPMELGRVCPSVPRGQFYLRHWMEP